MNKHSIVTGLKTAILSFLFAVVFAATSFAGSSNEAPASSKAFAVKFVGDTEDGYVFNVKYDNITSKNFDLLVKDQESGEILYQKSFADKNFSKRFQLSKSLSKAIFIIRPKQEAEQRFEVAVQARISEDIVVSRL